MLADRKQRDDIYCLLLSIRLLLEDKNNWTQESYARGPGKRAVHPCSSLAMMWCPLGAIIALSPSPAIQYLAIDFIEKITPGNDLTNFNDKRSHEKILVLLDKAINSFLK